MSGTIVEVIGYAGSALVITAILSLIVLKEPRHIAAESKDIAWQVSAKRSLAAQATLHGIVLHALSTRKTRDLNNGSKTHPQSALPST